MTLEGTRVRLESLTRDHHAGLCAVGLEPNLWKWIPVPVRSSQEMMTYIDKALDEHARGASLPFATIDATSERVIGSTRFMNIDTANKRMEIGSTWIAPEWQRTVANTEAKFLMLRYAFEELGCIRVEFKTDELNERSRAAILRIGAKQEGIFRNHVICHDGRIRHSVYFSITREEWPDIKIGLEFKMRLNAS